MTGANYVLFALGLLGGLDILLYHSVSHGIRSHADSKWELVAHACRGPTYAALFIVIPSFEAHGLFGVALAMLLAIDVGISMVDFSLEAESRRALGGLPTGEYVLHMMLAMLFGAFVALCAPHLIAWLSLPTQLHPSSDLAPHWLRLALGIMAILVFCSGLVDLIAAGRLVKLSARRSGLRPQAGPRGPGGGLS